MPWTVSGYPDLWAPLLYVLAGQYERKPALGEFVQAVRAGGPGTGRRSAPRHGCTQDALQRKLLDGLRYLLKEQLAEPAGSLRWLAHRGWFCGW